MCISCAVYSAIALFLPAPEPAPVVPTAIVFDTAYSDVETITPKDARVAIAALLDELPDSSDMAVMRSELETIQMELAAIEEDIDTDSFLNERLKELSQRVLSAPGADVVVEELMSMLIVDETDPAVKSLGWKLISPQQNKTLDLTGKSPNRGWLH